MPDNSVDILENDFQPDVLEQLLRDHTTQRNIFWATHDYEHLGEGYQYFDEIRPECITGENGQIVKPRVLKSKEQQTDRSKDMAEIFTPSWICNARNNLVDEAWFGRKGVFNIEDSASHTWKPNHDRIDFGSAGDPARNNVDEDVRAPIKTWRDYVRATRREMTCGEAPYLVSRYDTTTGAPIPLQNRIGLLDRKLRVVSENTNESGEWLEWAQIAYKNTYGFEWQGDSLLLAREALLLTFIEYYLSKFGKSPLEKSIKYIAYIISWNLWQMDGLKGVVPDSCRNGVVEIVPSLFGDMEKRVDCTGCQQDDIRKHNGTYCLIREWGAKDPRTGENNRKIRFIDLMK